MTCAQDPDAVTSEYRLLPDEQLASVVALCVRIDQIDELIRIFKVKAVDEEPDEWLDQRRRERDICTRAYKALGGKNIRYLPSSDS